MVWYCNTNFTMYFWNKHEIICTSTPMHVHTLQTRAHQDLHVHTLCKHRYTIMYVNVHSSISHIVYTTDWYQCSYTMFSFTGSRTSFRGDVNFYGKPVSDVCTLLCGWIMRWCGYTQQKLPCYSDIFFVSYWCISNNMFFCYYNRISMCRNNI